MKSTFLITALLIVFNCIVTHVKSQYAYNARFSKQVVKFKANDVPDLKRRAVLHKSTGDEEGNENNSVNEPDQHNYIPKKEVVLLGLTAGYSSAIGTFASRSFTNGSTNARSVKGDFSYDLFAIVKLSNFFGIRAAYDYQSFRIDHSAVDKYFANAYAGLTFTSSSTDWIIRGLSAGAYCSIKTDANPKAYVDFDLNLSMFNVTSPQTQIVISNGSANALSRHGTADAKSWGITAGMAFHYHINPAAAIIMRAGYLRCLPVYTNTQTSQSSANSINPANDYAILIESISIQAGLAIIIR